MQAMKLVFSIIVIIDKLDYLGLLLSCLGSQTFSQEQFECILIVEDFIDPIDLPVKTHQNNVKILSTTQLKVSLSKAKNLAATIATGEIIIFLANNVLPENNWLEAYYNAFASNKFDVVFIDRSEVLEVYKNHPENLLSVVSFVSGNLAIYRSLLLKTTGFLPLVNLMANLEMGLQLWEAKARFGFIEANVYRLHTKDTKENSSNLVDPKVLTDSQIVFYKHPYSILLKLLFWLLSPTLADNKPSCLTWIETDLGYQELASEYKQIYKEDIPVDCKYSKTAMIKYYCDITGISQKEIEAYLELAIKSGLIVENKLENKLEGEIFFDRYHTSNWLQHCTAYKKHEILRQYCHIEKTEFQQANNPKTLLSLSCKGKYEAIISPEGLPAPELKAILNLPLPMNHPCQSQIKITNCFPDNLLTYASYAQAMIIGLPIRLTESEIRIGYEFECKIDEFTSLANKADTETVDLKPFLQLNLPPAYISKAQAILNDIKLRVADHYQTAKTIYIWMLNNFHFAEGAFSKLFIFDAKMGTCIHWTRLFITLCRLLGIAAREQCGAILLRDPSSTDVYKTFTSNRGYNPFMHTWAEFYFASYGWVPVDFFGAGLGKRILTACNITDDNLRDQISQNTELFDEYYFGNLDPFRIYASERANKLPTYPIMTMGKSSTIMPDILWQTQHSLSCLLSK